MQALSIIKNIIIFKYKLVIRTHYNQFFVVNISSFFYLSEYYLIGEKYVYKKYS